MPIYENEARWCPHCEWNLESEDNQRKLDFYDRIYRDLGKKFSEKLFQEIIAHQISRPRLSRAKILAYAVAGAVHAITILMLPCAYLSFKTFATPIAVFVSCICLGIAWVTCPKPRQWPKEVVPREKMPQFYALLDRIADEMGTSRVSGVIIEHRYNAFYTEFGIGKWKKKVIGLGLPLAEVISNEELIAVLSHETSHGANGDVGRGVFIGSALDAIAKWYYICTPRHIDEGNNYRNNITIVLVNILGTLVGRIPWAAYYVLAHMLHHQRQEAEYLADRLSTEVCGTDAMLSMLTTSSHWAPFNMALSKAALSRGTIDLFKEMKARYELPQSDHDKERTNRLELRYGLSFDATHPPSPYRREFLAKTSSYKPKVQLSAEESIALRKELDEFKKDVATKLIDGYLTSIY